MIAPNLIPDYIHPTDTPNAIMLDSYDRWMGKYHEWGKEAEE